MMKIENIKFRGKDIETGNWVEGGILIDNGFSDSKPYALIEEPLDNKVYGVDTSTICQFTGFKDSKGIEIWENDILRVSSVNAKVVWRDDLGGFYLEDLAFDSLGNVPLGEMLSTLKYERIRNAND